MKILLINPPNIPFTEHALLIEPIDILTLATYLQKGKHKVRFLDMDNKKMREKELREYLESEFIPDVAIVSYDYHIPMHTQEALENINKIGKELKRHFVKTILIGKTVTYNPSIIDSLEFDIGIRGEAENVIKEILSVDLNHQKELAKIKGIVWKQNNNIKMTPCNETKYDLNQLPMANRELIDIADYIDIRSILTSRGCNNQCDFCPTYPYWGKWRGKRAETVVREIAFLVQNYHTKKIIFLDDNATVDTNRMQEISNQLIEKKMNVQLGCLSSINTYDRETFKKMYQAGFRWLHFGIESGSQKVLDNNHKNIKVEEAKKILKEVKQMGYRIRTSFIFDLPTTTKEDMKKTMDFILETEPDEIRGHFLTLRLGTKIYETISKKEKIPIQYIHSDKPLLENEEYCNSELLQDIDILIKELERKGYKIVRNTKEWQELEKLRNKDGKIRFLSFCPSKYGIDWEK